MTEDKKTNKPMSASEFSQKIYLKKLTYPLVELLVRIDEKENKGRKRKKEIIAKLRKFNSFIKNASEQQSRHNLTVFDFEEDLKIIKLLMARIKIKKKIKDSELN